ncbi:5-oxoprolinase subunit PxpB [uncultured Winogradskyella sp.]|uniref:5-oxoprolinase subunit PxpB n=1 Tax=uncultured Winogradskyella sp. TaxID=395353 RepID=UPI0026274C16|nr:5-oxoprolinase subunit PxpB [uncultured Winogradskyella sp.]|tara:strand:- start:169 stop:897 length:729 start_codon:yes stop_codon:yes gene_type:complete
MKYKLQFLQYNECSILVEWPAIIDKNMLNDILNFKNLIQNKYGKQIVEVIAAYNSILIFYVSTIEDVNSVFLDLELLYDNCNSISVIESNTFRIPVCYDDEFAVDIDDYSRTKKLTKEEIIKRHIDPIYTVFFIGFLPGFLYLGGLDFKLHLDRKKTPNLNVKKGAVAIGGKQTGIYPQDSPGGWHIIGNSPIELFNPKQDPPCFIKAGDKVKFHAISKSEYFEIQNEITLSRFDIKTLLIV